MSSAPITLLGHLESIARTFTPEAAAEKVVLLDALARAKLSNARAVLRLHEVLCFLRAVPDDEAVLERAERMLGLFHRRGDLRRHRRELADSGIQGTDLHLGFYAPMARWVAEHWGDRLHIDWPAVEKKELLRDRMYLLGLEGETPALDHADLTARQWIDRMKGPEETDGAFVVRRFASVNWPEHLRDTLLDELELPLVLRGDADTPSRTRARAPGGTLRFQTGPMRSGRPDLQRAIRTPPVSIRRVDAEEGRAYVELAREAMVTRDRALDAFAGGDANDVTLVDCGEGLEFAVIGSKPGWRMLLEAVHGWVTLRNRVPIGYVLSATMFKSTEVAYNVFDTWRGGEAGWVYGRVLATCRALLGSDTFTIYPYQLGHGNAEGLASGAWWFYQKLGFRPRDPAVLALMESELAAMKKEGGYRSSKATLKQLARANVYYALGKERKAIIGEIPLDRIGLAVTDGLARRFGSDRERGERVLANEAGALLGVPDWWQLPTGERKAWLRWAPLVAALPGVEDWPREDLDLLAEIVCAKGGRSELEFITLFDGHKRLRRALTRLADRR